MDFCNKCGSQTDTDWVFCRSCGNSLDSRDIEAATAPQAIPNQTAPKVELISRGWDIVDVDTVDLPADPLQENDVVAPLAPGTIEISIDDVTVIERSTEEEVEVDGAAAATTETITPEEQPVSDTPVEVPSPVDPADAWDHLRPHGQMPDVAEPARIPAQVSQILVLVAALAALVSSVIFLFANIELDRFASGKTSAGTATNIQSLAEMSLVALAVLGVIALAGVGWWMIKAFPVRGFRPGPAEFVALAALLGGTAMVLALAMSEPETVAGALTANSLVVLGLGLLMAAGLAAVRTISRIDGRGRR